ncbi:MAG: tetraacyldisaccharide 4'-kinase [Bdellovibrionaceae bacterium]|nr:tetraacyldisaccharide 4'-kinase [Pseudobdellovibrionaceae bacterium]
MMRLLLSPILVPLSFIYAAVVALRNLFFDRGLFVSDDCGAVVVSIGNLSAGGTGKTPITAVLAERLGRGRRLGIVSRGYGRKSRESMRVQPGAENAPSLFGDEATWLAARLAVPVQVGAKRVRAAQDLVASEGVRLILLDDGFQHRWLARDFDIVLIDASAPHWQMAPLPWGRRREPWKALRRASAVFLTKTSEVSEEALREIESCVRREVGETIPILRWVQEARLPSVPSGRGVLVAGIAKPSDFFSGVEAIVGRECVVERIGYSDHHDYTPSEVEAILRTAQEAKADWVATTEKDFVKLSRLWPASAVLLLSSTLEVRPARESDQVELERLYVRIEKVLNVGNP